MTSKRVVATATGFHGGEMRRPGDVFDVPEKLGAKWFKPFQSPAADKADTKPKGKPEAGARPEGRASDQNVI